MTKFIGALSDVGIAKEASRGTAESSATFYLPKMTLDFDDMVETVDDENSIGVIEDMVDSKVVKKFAEGVIEGKINDKAIGLLLYAALGAKAVSGPSDSAYTHTFTVGQSSQHPALTIFVDDSNQDYKYALGMIKSLELNAEVGKFCRFKVGIRSKVGETATLTPSYGTENSFLAQHATFKLASTQSGLDAADAMNIRSINLKIEKNVEDDSALGTTAPVDILNKQFAIEGELEIVFDDETMKTEMLADTAQALRLELENTDVLIGSSSTPKLTVDLHYVKFKNFKRNYGNGDIVTASVQFKAFYKPADSKMVTITLINGQSSY